MVNKVTPVRGLHVPRYPTIHEIGNAELSRVPSRWANLKSVVASIGTAAMALKSLALEANAEAAPAAPSAEAPRRGAEAARHEVNDASPTDVCPLAAVAVAGEGRGGFGCVAMNPPVMLGEAEALEIFFRVRAIDKNAAIRVMDGEKQLARFKREHMAPGEMENIKIPRVLLDRIAGNALTVEIEEAAQ